MAKEKRKKSKARKIILIVIITLLGIIAILALVYVGSLLKLRKKAKDITADITPETFRQTQTSIVYDINGDEMTSLSGIKELYYVEAPDIPDILKSTFVLIEDKDFYNHKGIDFSAIIRASIANIASSKIQQGASTITQQLAKNIFLTQSVTWDRKITEMFTAIEIEKKFSKEQILEFYINNIYFANGYYGIEAAAKGYFGKDVGDLSLSQLTFLAGIPKSPYRYDPITHLDAAVSRRDDILKQLFANGTISSLEYFEATQEDIVLDGKKEDKYDYVQTYLFNCATKALMEANGFVFKYEFDTEDEQKEYEDRYSDAYSEYQKSLFTGGYRIYTAIDLNKQDLLQSILDDKLKDFTGVDDDGVYKLQGAGTCIDNNTGFVTAIVGGRTQEHEGYTFNRAYQSYRQPGSSIKPIVVYAPYLSLSHTPDEIIDDSPMQDGPKNNNDTYLGKISLTRALGVSSNVCAWKLMESMTPAYGMSFLHEMDFQKIDMDDDNQAVSIGGFTYGVSPVEMASAYAALENDGTYRNPTCVEKITDSKNNVIIDNSGNEIKVYDTIPARMVTYMLEEGVNNEILTGAQLKNAIVAAKSGTTNDNKDGWLIGYSRYYTTAVWVGCDIPKPVEGLTGGSYPLNIWHDYMEEIHKGLELKEFQKYTDVETNSSYEEETTTEAETPTHPGYSGNTLDIGDGDSNQNVNGMGDQSINVNGMGDRNSR